MQVVLNKKSVTKEIPLYSVALYLNMCFSLVVKNML